MRASPRGICSPPGTVRLGRGLVVYLPTEEVNASLAELNLSETLRDGTYPSVFSTSTYSQVLGSPAFTGLFLFPMPLTWRN